MAIARGADLGRETERYSRARIDATPRSPRVRSRVVAGFLVRIATRIDPSVVPATREGHAPAFTV
ncbi:MAG TPA: hypothetical protein VIY26_10090 [Acidimicrobiales bacterium]